MNESYRGLCPTIPGRACARRQSVAHCVPRNSAYNPLTMRSRLARFLLILTALWLPLQAVAGMTMKLAMPGAALSVQQAQDTEAEACPYHAHESESPAPIQSHRQACDDCGICHFAAAGYLPMAEVAAAIVPAEERFVPMPAFERASHIPEPPQFPPKRS